MMPAPNFLLETVGPLQDAQRTDEREGIRMGLQLQEAARNRAWQEGQKKAAQEFERQMKAIGALADQAKADEAMRRLLTREGVRATMAGHQLQPGYFEALGVGPAIFGEAAPGIARAASARGGVKLAGDLGPIEEGYGPQQRAAIAAATQQPEFVYQRTPVEQQLAGRQAAVQAAFPGTPAEAIAGATKRRKVRVGAARLSEEALLRIAAARGASNEEMNRIKFAYSRYNEVRNTALRVYEDKRNELVRNRGTFASFEAMPPDLQKSISDEAARWAVIRATGQSPAANEVQRSYAAITQAPTVEAVQELADQFPRRAGGGQGREFVAISGPVKDVIATFTKRPRTQEDADSRIDQTASTMFPDDYAKVKAAAAKESEAGIVNGPEMTRYLFMIQEATTALGEKAVPVK